MRSAIALLHVVLHMITHFRGASAFATTLTRAHAPVARRSQTAMMATAANATSAPAAASDAAAASPRYLAEGLLAVHKPLTWTSQDVVSYIRGILTRDAKDRGVSEGGAAGGGGGGNRKRGRNKKPMMKVGHGGTLDPLASGVLVLGIGKGTTMLQSYLEGDKQYVAACHLGYETDTLDAEGKLVKEAPWEHVKSIADVEAIVPKFTGKIEQIPPMYSAIRVDGQRLYEMARKDAATADDVEIPKREVEIYGLQVETALHESAIRSGVADGPRYREAAAAKEAAIAAKEAAEAAAKSDGEEGVDANEGNDDEGGKAKKKRRRDKRKRAPKKSLFDENDVPAIGPDHGELELPRFALSVRCGGGTYIRSLVRDIGYELDTVATMTGLVRTKQGPYVLEDALRREDWTAEKIYDAIRLSKERQIG